jgi:hypothetical protein
VTCPVFLHQTVSRALVAMCIVAPCHANSFMVPTTTLSQPCWSESLWVSVSPLQYCFLCDWWYNGASRRPMGFTSLFVCRLSSIIHVTLITRRKARRTRRGDAEDAAARTILPPCALPMSQWRRFITRLSRSCVAAGEHRMLRVGVGPSWGSRTHVWPKVGEDCRAWLLH